MTIVAHALSFVIGVDTHAKSHALSIVKASTGEHLDSAQFPTTNAGLHRALSWVKRRTGTDTATLWVIECCATYGARLATTATKAGYQVVEAPRLNTKTHRDLGKSDPLDAHRIAAAVLPLEQDQLRHPRKDDGVRLGLRVLITARDHMTTERTATINALLALLRAADLGIDARKPLTGKDTIEVSKWRARAEDIGLATARSEAVRLAQRVLILDNELAENTKTTTQMLAQSPARTLLNEPGIGPVTAAVAMAAWSHEGRIRSEAAFATLAGVNPIPASSGNTTRHRLNRGGDRRLNQALHIAVLVRMRIDPETKAYVERRTTEGHTKRETRRCLKRYLARKIYRTLNTTQTT